uniref:Uncharacterized protein n=1 Tax=Oryza nivara TaxID=4536 RepID=A0A0E0IW43_ORYNI
MDWDDLGLVLRHRRPRHRVRQPGLGEDPRARRRHFPRRPRCARRRPHSLGTTISWPQQRSIYGENARDGTPTNPCAPGSVPGGSSSGSAVAVAANLANPGVVLRAMLAKKEELAAAGNIGSDPYKRRRIGADIGHGGVGTGGDMAEMAQSRGNPDLKGAMGSRGTRRQSHWRSWRRASGREGGAAVEGGGCAHSEIIEQTEPGNMLKNGGFEEGPYIFPNTSWGGTNWGVLVPPMDEDDHTPLSPWTILSTTKSVKYIDAAHYAVPGGARAVELVSGMETAMVQEVSTVPGRSYRLEFSVGDAGDGCSGSLTVQARAAVCRGEDRCRDHRHGSPLRRRPHGHRRGVGRGGGHGQPHRRRHHPSPPQQVGVPPRRRRRRLPRRLHRLRLLLQRRPFRHPVLQGPVAGVVGEADTEVAAAQEVAVEVAGHPVVASSRRMARQGEAGHTVDPAAEEEEDAGHRAAAGSGRGGGGAEEDADDHHARRPPRARKEK